MVSPSSVLSGVLVLYSLYAPLVYAATIDEWRSRSIYQVIIDRYALPKGSDPNVCDPAKRTWCGGTWNTLRDNLDYIQDAGFTAVWISPVSQNYQGPRTPYGDPYHGYWVADVAQLNNKFGSSDDLKALSSELHKRSMYLMVDVVVNNVMALSTTPDLSPYFFKNASQYHRYCPIDWGNTTSEQVCWLGDTAVTLPDLKTEDPTVMSGYGSWINELVKTYSIDGIRIDAAKHINMQFWPEFCASAGIFCIGEVYNGDPAQTAPWQGKQALDSILNYPMYGSLLSAFTIPGPKNMSAVTSMVSQVQSLFSDPSVLGNFLENQDVPRWANLSVDPQSLHNAIVYNFMSDGIPIVYYGQEQGFEGGSDPYNREPLWPSHYAQTTAYKLIKTLNQLRNYLVAKSDWAKTRMQILTSTQNALAFTKGPVLTVVTNIGSPPSNTSIPMYTKHTPSTVLTEVLSCHQYVVGSNGALQVDYYNGGHAAVFVTQKMLRAAGLCGAGGSTFSTENSARTSESAPLMHPWRVFGIMRVKGAWISLASALVVALAALSI